MDTTLDLFMKAGDSAFAIDDAQTILLWNRTAEKTTGYAAYETIGKPCWRVFQGCDTKGRAFCRRDCPLIQQVRQGKSPPAFNLFTTHNYGHLVPVNMSTIYRPENGLPSRLIHLFRPLAVAHTENIGQLRVQLFGPILVQQPDGTAVAGQLWRRIKVRALLAFLALQAGRSIARQTLLDTLWPTLPYDDALHNLNTTIYNLRRSLEPDLMQGNQSRYIQYQGGHYYLSKKYLWVDVIDFKQQIKNGQAEIEPQQALIYYQQAARLYQDDYLTEFVSISHWFREEQKRIHDLYVGLLETMADLHLDLGQEELACNLYLKVIARAPSRRHSRQRLLSLLNPATSLPSMTSKTR